jgi:hypothetical protein
MTTQVGIYNRVLTKLGSQPVTSTSDESEQCRVLNRIWEYVRDAELRDNNWNFAITRASLSADGTAPAWGYDTRYAMPSDCLRIIEIDGFTGLNEPLGSVGPGDPDFRIEGRYILCDETSEIDIRYISKEINVSDWDSLFVDAIAARMAFEACEPLTNNASKKEQFLRDYKEAISKARRADGIETPAEPLQEDSWLLARF